MSRLPPLYIVSVGPSPTSENLVHSAVRLARDDRAELIAVCVASDNPRFNEPDAQRQLNHNLDAARGLGLEVVVLRGGDPAHELVSYARLRGATRLIVGRNRDRGLIRLLRRPFGRRLDAMVGPLELITIPSLLPDGTHDQSPPSLLSAGIRQLPVSALLLAASVSLALGLRCAGAPASVQVLVLIVAVVVAGAFGLGVAMTVALGAVLVFNFGFTEPLYSLWVDDPWNWLVFTFVLIVGLVVGSLTQRLKTQAELVRSREQRLESLYRLSRDLAKAGTAGEVEELSRSQFEAATGVLRDSMEWLLATARDRVVRIREAQAAHFLQGFSHDLRTPLSVISGTAHALIATTKGRLWESEIGLLTTIEQESHDLSAQLETVLDLARLAEPTLEGRLQWVPAEELLVSCRDSFLKRRTGRSLLLHLPPDLHLVHVEPGLVERALMNLVENADHYSPAGQQIELGLETSKSHTGFVVSDRGPGVSQSERELIFERFFRGQASKQRHSRRGAGLGLALVREIARAHGGEAFVSDRQGGGAEFRLTIAAHGSAPEVTHD